MSDDLTARREAKAYRDAVESMVMLFAPDLPKGVECPTEPCPSCGRPAVALFWTPGSTPVCVACQ